jgi:hypothetical protein
MWPLRVVMAVPVRSLRMVFVLRGLGSRRRLRRRARGRSRRCASRRCGSIHLRRDAVANLGDARTQRPQVLGGDVPGCRVLGHEAREAIERELGPRSIVRGHRRIDTRQLLAKPGCFAQTQLWRSCRRAAATERKHRQHCRQRRCGPCKSRQHTADDGNANPDRLCARPRAVRPFAGFPS